MSESLAALNFTISIKQTSSHKHVSALRLKKLNLNRLAVKIHMFLALKSS